MSDVGLCLRCGEPLAAHGFGASCRIFLRRARPRPLPVDPEMEELLQLRAQAVQDAILVQQAESRYAGLKAGVEQVIAEMRRFKDHGWADALASLLETP